MPSCLIRAWHFLLDWTMDYGCGLFLRGLFSCKIGTCITLHELTYSCAIFMAISFNSISLMLVGISQLLSDRKTIQNLLIASTVLSAMVDIFIIISVLVTASLDRQRESRLHGGNIGELRRSVGLTSNPKKNGRIASRARRNQQEQSDQLLDDDVNPAVSEQELNELNPDQPDVETGSTASVESEPDEESV